MVWIFYIRIWFHICIILLWFCNFLVLLCMFGVIMVIWFFFCGNLFWYFITFLVLYHGFGIYYGFSILTYLHTVFTYASFYYGFGIFMIMVFITVWYCIMVFCCAFGMIFDLQLSWFWYLLWFRCFVMIWKFCFAVSFHALVLLWYLVLIGINWY